MESTTKNADALYRRCANCAQSVLAAFAAKYGMDEALAMRVAGGLGGGMRCGEVCGAAAGAALVIGLKHGAATPEDLERKKLCGEKTLEFMNAFRARFNALRCRDLLAARGKKSCDQLIGGAVETLEELGY